MISDATLAMLRPLHEDLGNPSRKAIHKAIAFLFYWQGQFDVLNL